MAAIFITDTELAGLTKNVYTGIREKLIPVISPVLAQVEKAKRGGARNFRWGGKGVIFDAVTTRPGGFAASASGTFPSSHAAKEENGTLDIKRFYVTREVDALAWLGTESKEAAFKSLGRKIVEEMKDAITLGMAEMIQGDGKGIRALVGTYTNANNMTFVSPYGVSGAGQGGLFIHEGMEIALLDTSAADAVLGRAIVSTVTNSGDTCTVVLAGSGISGGATGDKVVGCARATDTSFNQYINGLMNITNRGGSYASLHGLSGAQWDATRLTSSDVLDVEVVSESDFFDLIMKVRGRSGKDAKAKPGEFLVCGTPGLEKKLVEQFYPSRTLTPQDFVELKGGYKAVSVFGLPFISDSFCPAGTVYLIHIPSMSWVDAKDWGEVRLESAPAWRPLSNQDGYQFTMGAYMQLGTTNRGAHGSITGYTDTGRYSIVV